MSNKNVLLGAIGFMGDRGVRYWNLRYKLHFPKWIIIETSKDRYQMELFHDFVINRIVLARVNRMITLWRLLVGMPVGKSLSFNSNEIYLICLLMPKAAAGIMPQIIHLKATIRDILEFEFYSYAISHSLQFEWYKSCRLKPIH